MPSPRRPSYANPVDPGLGVIEAHQLLALLDERGADGARESFERTQLEHRLLGRRRDLPETGDEAVREECGEHLCGEDDRLAVGVGQDSRPLGCGVTQDRRVKARQEARRGVRVRVGTWRGREIDELASSFIGEVP